MRLSDSYAASSSGVLVLPRTIAPSVRRRATADASALAGAAVRRRLPARVGGPGFTYIRDKRDNPLESTKGNYFTLDGSVAAGLFGSEADFGRALAQNSTYHAFGGKGKAERQFVFARSTSIGLEQPFRGTRVVPPGACPINPQTLVTVCQGFNLIPLPEQFFAGGGNSHRGFGLNQAGPRDPQTGYPIGGNALFLNSVELRTFFAQRRLGLVLFEDAGNVYSTIRKMRLLKVTIY